MAEQMNEQINEQTGDVKIPKRILNTLLNSLSAGVVPRNGAPYIAIGRQDEIVSLLDSLQEVYEGGGNCRFVIGRYGSGKSFLIQLIRGYAIERGFICADADLSPERRLSGGNGAGRATYRELMSHLSCKAAPDGGALSVILNKLYATIKEELAEQGVTPDDENYVIRVRRRALATMKGIDRDVGGYDFSHVIYTYYVALVNGDEQKMNACLRWLRGEYSTKTEAKTELGFQVGCIIDDSNWYDIIKLFSMFLMRLGYSGLVVFIDECINLYKIPNRIAREANYEKILSIFNDTLQGRARFLGFIFGGTPQFLEDPRRGLFSYEALRSRLSDSHYEQFGYRTLSTPVIRLRRLSDNELLALVRRLTKLYAQREGTDKLLISDEQSERFIREALARAGATELVTPREVIRDYMTLLNILRDNPEVNFDTLMDKMKFTEPGTDEETPAKTEKPENGKSNKVDIFDIEI